MHIGTLAHTCPQTPEELFTLSENTALCHKVCLKKNPNSHGLFEEFPGDVDLCVGVGEQVVFPGDVSHPNVSLDG